MQHSESRRGQRARKSNLKCEKSCEMLRDSATTAVSACSDLWPFRSARRTPLSGASIRSLLQMTPRYSLGLKRSCRRRRRRRAGTRIDSSALPVRTESQKDSSGEEPSGSSLLLLASNKVASSRRTFLPAGRREQRWWRRNEKSRNAQGTGRSAQCIIRMHVCCRQPRVVQHGCARRR